MQRHKQVRFQLWAGAHLKSMEEHVVSLDVILQVPLHPLCPTAASPGCAYVTRSFHAISERSRNSWRCDISCADDMLHHISLCF
jgi:hypothetical protein